MLRFAAAFLLLSLAAPAFAQPSSGPPETASEIDAAAEAFAHCIGVNAERVDAETTPEVGAAAVLATCAPHRRRLENIAEMVIATLPLERRAAARERMRASLASAEGRVADGIRAQRAAGSSAPPAGAGTTPQ